MTNAVRPDPSASVADEDLDSLADALRELVPFETKLRVPEPRDGVVDRPGLLDVLGRPTTPPVVLVTAPAGYGKTTLLSQWAARDDRPAAWLSLSESDNDPAVLRAYLALAFDELGPLAPTAFAGLATSQADLQSVLLPRLGRAFSSVDRPCVLILDDVHVVRSAAGSAILDVLTAHVPPGSHLVLAARRDPALPVARMVTAGAMLRIDESHLAMTAPEATALLRAAGADVDRETGAALVETTEGWPAGLYLAALVLRDAATRDEAAVRFTGAERSVADYFRDEVLRTLSADEEEFLLRTSVLPRLSGPLCDRVLERSDCAGVLDALARSNLFIVPLDRRGEWFRYHHAFRDMLLAELRRREPRAETRLRDRACAWFAARGDLDEAIEQAHGIDDLGALVGLVWAAAPAFVGSGRTGTVWRWLEPLSKEQIAARPALAVVAGWCALTDGETQDVDAWLAEAERGPVDEVFPNGTPLRSALALLRAIVGAQGLEQVRDDAATAYELDVPESPYRSVARFVEGTALGLLGDTEGGRTRLNEAIHLAGTRVPAIHTQSLGQLALLAFDDGQWVEAATLVDRALHVVDASSMTERPAMTCVYATAALVRAREGATIEATRLAKHAAFLLEMLTGVGPWLALQARGVLARTSLALGDPGAARMLLDDADRILRRYPDPGTIPARVADVRRVVDAAATPIGITATPLTPAEMRVLRYLPTHLTFAGIATELFVSRNTVKTQAIAIYRKLGVTSRTAAVEMATDIGIIEA